MTVKQKPSRRERQRQATYDEIIDSYRSLLVQNQDVSVRGVAAEMGMTPAALYRYVDGAQALEDLVSHSILHSVVELMVQAGERYSPADPAAEMVASAATFRKWALQNPGEFRLVFARAVRVPQEQGTRTQELQTLRPGIDFPGAGPALFSDHFGQIFIRIWANKPFSLPPVEDLDVSLVVLYNNLPAEQRERLDQLGPNAVGMLWLFKLAWARLYGIVTLEVFGQLEKDLVESGAVFAAVMQESAASLGLAQEWHRLVKIARAEAWKSPNAPKKDTEQ